MDDGSVFEIGKYYKHSSGQKMAIRGEIETYYHGKCLVGEDEDACLIPVSGNDNGATVNWYEISKEEWTTRRDLVTESIPDILNSQTSYRTRADLLFTVLVQLGASKAATDMVQSLSEGYGFDPLFGLKEGDSGGS